MTDLESTQRKIHNRLHMHKKDTFISKQMKKKVCLNSQAANVQSIKCLGYILSQ